MTKTTNTLRCGILICAAIAISQGVGKTIRGQESAPSVSAVDMLLSTDKGIRERGRRELLTAQSELVAQLSKNIADHANGDASHEGVKETMYVLGELRSVEAIDVLVEHIGFPFIHYPERVDSGRRARHARPLRWKPLEADLPAIRALVNIGPPCISPVVKKLAATDNKTEYDACEIVLRAIDWGAPKGQPRIKEAMDWAYTTTADPERRNQLSRTRRLLGLDPVPEGFGQLPRTEEP